MSWLLFLSIFTKRRLIPRLVVKNIKGLRMSKVYDTGFAIKPWNTDGIQMARNAIASSKIAIVHPLLGCTKYNTRLNTRIVYTRIITKK